ncbi:integrator complex subunit 1-like [Patiria miniata]|uniref:Integrator complex subunit 1 n=1 Tax=Patiria miniata TaxID=46514 RepID=A0A914AJX0_PATMI|nr:integrator complex subunit 1-like [Patiria miniata]
MERNKQLGKKLPGRRILPAGEIIALGAKSRPGGGQDGSELRANPEWKREAPTTSAGPPHKIAKVSGQTFTPLGRGVPESSKGGAGEHVIKPGIKTIEVPASELLDQVLDADGAEDDDRIDGLLCGALKTLKSTRAKPGSQLYLSLMYLAKIKPMLFESEDVVDYVCSLLKRDISLSFKSKGNPLVSVLACNLLMHAYLYEDNWPIAFVKVFLEDAMGERVWVDHPSCREFCSNIQTAFGTKMPPRHLMLPIDQLRHSTSTPDLQSGSPLRDDSDLSSESAANQTSEDMDLTADVQAEGVTARYSLLKDSIETYVVDFVRDQLTRRQGMDTPRNLLRVLTAACGFPEVRLLAATRLEMWLQNPKLTRPAQELLMAVCLNCDTHGQEDVEVIGHLIKIRLKTKPLINHYMLSMKELLNQHSDNLSTLLKHTIYNELSNSRNPNNMPLLATIFQHSPEASAKFLANVFQDLLMNRDDYLRAVRALFREIVKSLRYDLDFPAFCRGLMKERTDKQFIDMEAQFKDRMLLSLTDLIVLAALLSVSPAIKEAVAAYTRGDRKDMDVLRAFQNQASVMQRDAVWWLHTVAPKMFKVNQQDFNQCLQKVLFMEPSESYCSKDNWPPESDRSLLLSLLSEVPVQEDTLMRVLVMGLSRELPLTAADGLELADKLVKRAAVLYAEDFPVLKVERIQLIDAVLNLCAYHHPENIQLPQGYTPPSLAISNLYWKGWILLVVITAFNPTNIGLSAWERYPMLRCFMEMVMTNNFKYPPPTAAPDERSQEEVRTRELQVIALEKQEILEFENHLARVAITEANSLLLSQVIRMDPNGIARRPPAQVLEQLQHFNKVLNLGHMLCRSRSPDFLLDIIQRQGTSQSMPWLAELVNSAEGSLDVLPVQCLCEFLLNDNQDSDAGEESKKGDAKRKQRIDKQEQLLSRLQTLVRGPDSQASTCCEVMDYFLRRLSSQQQASRSLAAKGLMMVLSVPEDKNTTEEDTEDPPWACPTLMASHEWLLKNMPSLPHFDPVRASATTALRQACQIETDPLALSAYVVFLSQFAPVTDLNDLAVDLAQLIVERPTIVSCILPRETYNEVADVTLAAMIKIFSRYLLKATKPNEEGYSWSDTQDQVFLYWQTGESATMHILIVHAMVILLTYGQPKVDSDFQLLLHSWFPENSTPPQAYLVDTSEDALLLPDWLKLRMIRSSVPELVIAALQDLEPAQLVLFIQSFGIPTASMSQLLAHLDAAVVQDSQAMENAVVDKAYMAQLVEVQQMRGASGGVEFHKLLTEGVEEPSDKDKDKVESKKEESVEKMDTSESAMRLPDEDHQEEWCKLLIKLFKDESSEESRQVFAIVQQEILKDIRRLRTDPLHKPSEMLTSSLLSIVKDGSLLPSQLTKRADIGGPLLSLLLTREKLQQKYGSPSTFPELVQYLCEALPTKEGTLAQTLIHCQKELSVSSVDVNVDQALKEMTGDSQENKQESMEKVVKAFRHGQAPANDELLEQVCRQLLDSNANQMEKLLTTSLTASHGRRAPSQASQRVGMLSRLLTHQQQKHSSTSGTQTSSHPQLLASTSGLLTDWLALLDPEACQACPDLQQQAIFAPAPPGNRNSPSSSGDSQKRIGSAYLLALLTHQANWGTLHKCIDRLLGPARNAYSFSATAVLDFLWACIHIPKIWQGRDTRASKRHSEEDVLCLSPDQICALADYIIQEAADSSGQYGAPPSATPNASPITTPSAPPSASPDADEGLTELASNTIKARLSLLLTSFHGNKGVAEHLIRYLGDCSRETNPSSALYQQLLLELYLQVPETIQNLSFISTKLQSQDTSNIPTPVDCLTHRLLCVLADSKPGDTSKQKADDANVACRKLAAEHPVLILRQLAMVTVLLQGRTHLNFKEFRVRGHLRFFNHILGILQLLEPQLFAQPSTVLHGIMEAYFPILPHSVIAKKPLESIITKFIQLLYQYSSHNPTQAQPLLEKHSTALNNLSQVYPDIQQLKSLLASITLTSSSKDQSGLGSAPNQAEPAMDEIPGVGGREETYSPTLAAMMGADASWDTEDVKSFAERLSQEEDSEGMAEALNELEEKSSSAVGILQHFVTELSTQMTSCNKDCRQTAFVLVIRYIRHDPSVASKFLPAYMECLNSMDQEVVQTALKNLPEFTLLCQENAEVVLQKAFTVGVNSKLSTVPLIAETLKLLSMDSASTTSNTTTPS